MQDKAVPVRTFESIFEERTTPFFQVKSLKEASGGKGIVRQPHRHDFYYVQFIKKGSGTHTIDFKEYKVNAQSLFFVTPGQIHATKLSTDVEGYSLFFQKEFFLLSEPPGMLSDFPFFHTLHNEQVIYLNDEEQKDTAYLLESIFNEFQQKRQGSASVMKSLLKVLLIRSARYFLEQHSDTSQSYHLSYQLRTLESLIDLYYKEYRTLSKYADVMCFSPQHLNSLCKKGLNKTVIQLLHERINLEAKRLLLFTEMTVSHIADELGYSDKSNFINFFKKHCGDTPENFRRKNKSTKYIIM